MKRCMVQGDMLADRTCEQYPTVTLCEACIREDEQSGPNRQILVVEGASDGALDDTCEWCGHPA
ncbi:MAG: hypothetical protein ACLGJA_01440 [Gammaproteobacteria bacterium]|jgi:hypothetical protein